MCRGGEGGSICCLSGSGVLGLDQDDELGSCVTQGHTCLSLRGWGGGFGPGPGPWLEAADWNWGLGEGG